MTRCVVLAAAAIGLGLAPGARAHGLEVGVVEVVGEGEHLRVEVVAPRGSPLVHAPTWPGAVVEAELGGGRLRQRVVGGDGTAALGPRPLPTVVSVRAGGLDRTSVIPPAGGVVSVARAGGFVDAARAGLAHVLAGLDHLLLLFVLALGARSEGRPHLPRLAGRVTAFTVGHALAMTAVIAGLTAPSASVIEPLIALSVALAAASVLTDAERRGTADAAGSAVLLPRSARLESSARGAVVFVGFGLLHGLGFAGALPDATARLESLLALNLGVELAQLAIVTVFALLLAALGPRPRLERWALEGVGLVAGVWVVARIVGGPST